MIFDFFQIAETKPEPIVEAPVVVEQHIEVPVEKEEEVIIEEPVQIVEEHHSEPEVIDLGYVPMKQFDDGELEELLNGEPASTGSLMSTVKSEEDVSENNEEEEEEADQETEHQNSYKAASFEQAADYYY
eukprot:GHVL01008699.1.p1 GENE.GHVL01008699.1~~GHVL01008699.1.p1  ORF type:complete len:130 (+),score=40.38 GHVL01008699.1:143-532(+)